MKLLLLTLLLLASGQVFASDEHGLLVSDAWIREAPPNVMMMAGYLKIENTSPEQRTLIGASSTAFSSVEVHTTMIENDVARMRHVPELVIAAGQTATFSPGAMHLMLMGPTSVLKSGDTVEIQFDFGDQGNLTTLFPVRRPQ